MRLPLCATTEGGEETCTNSQAAAPGISPAAVNYRVQMSDSASDDDVCVCAAPGGLLKLRIQEEARAAFTGQTGSH